MILQEIEKALLVDLAHLTQCRTDRLCDEFAGVLEQQLCQGQRVVEVALADQPERRGDGRSPFDREVGLCEVEEWPA